MRQQEREKTYTTRDGGAATRGGDGGRSRRQAQECETEYEPVEAGLRDEGGSPTFSGRQQELGGKATLDGWRIPTARDNHSRTGWA